MSLKSFKHINQEERIQIYSLRSQGFSIRYIALKLKRSHSSISREFSRNSTDCWRGIYSYKPLQAERHRIKRRILANLSHIKLRSNHSLRQKIYYYLSKPNLNRGPDEIIWRLRLEWFDTVCTSTLYRYIFNYTNRARFLRFKHYRKRYSKDKRSWGLNHIPLIDTRPIQANERSEIWHWECDTIVGKDHQSWLVTITERKSRFELIMKIPDFTKQSTYSCIKYLLHNHIVKSLTSDNWKEFTNNHKLNFNCFRANPYSCYERWTNERHNWLIRRFIPKSTDINTYSHYEILKIQNILNHKPRKILGYRTPYEVYYSTVLNYIS